MNRKRLTFAFLHRFVGLRILRAVTNEFLDSESASVQEIIDFIMPRLSPKEKTRVEDAISQPNALEHLRSELENGDVTVIAKGEDLYPTSLLDFRDPPPLLYVKGDISSLQLPGIGICGSRKASSVGLKHAEAFGEITANEEITEISGYARGVDERAHLGALHAGGKSIAILAEGILHFRQKKVYRNIPDIEKRMVVVSEFHPWRPWHVSTAMKRNLTILGLSRALVVVEAGAKGGTLDAGLKCLKHKKPLWVLNYGEESARPEGNNKLIAVGGVPVETNNQLRSLIRRIAPQSNVGVTPTPRQSSLAL